MKTDSAHILCVNPWIHDFAAYDFWAKPIGLLTIAAILRDQGIQISYIDCLDRFHSRESAKVKILWDGRGPYRKTPIDLPDGLEDETKTFSRYGIKPEWFLDDLKSIKKPDLIFVTSLMTYWASGVQETIKAIKEELPDVPVILGGIYASLCHDHAMQESGADLVIKGHAETQLKKIIYDYMKVEIDDTALSENLDDLPFPALDLQSKTTYAPLLTSRGCPFSCEYCASPYLEPRLRRRSPENVFQEITHWVEKYHVRNFAFYDDALLVNSETYAFPLFEKIIKFDRDLFFHTPNAIHINAITQKAADLMFQAGFKAIRLGLETTDFSKDRQHDVKVKKDQFYTAVGYLKSAGFEEEQLGAYLLCGLPDQNLDEVESSMDLVREMGITPVLAYYTPIPHTPMWEHAVKKAKYNLTKHPVFTNNTLFPCVHSQDDLKRIGELKNS